MEDGGEGRGAGGSSRTVLSAFRWSDQRLPATRRHFGHSSATVQLSRIGLPTVMADFATNTIHRSARRRFFATASSRIVLIYLRQIISRVDNERSTDGQQRQRKNCICINDAILPSAYQNKLHVGADYKRLHDVTFEIIRKLKRN